MQNLGWGHEKKTMNCESVNGRVVCSLQMDGVLVAAGVNARCGRSGCSLRTERVFVAD